MCDALSLTLLAVGSATMGAIQAAQEIADAQSYNDAVIDAYNQEVEMARSKAVVDQSNLQTKTQSEQLENQQQRRQATQEAMRYDAAAEASASSLNIAGNSTMRREAVADVNALNREGAYAARGESVNVQHMMSALGIKDTYETNVRGSEMKADAAWRPMSGAVLSGVMGGLGTAVNIFGSGLSMGTTLGVGGDTSSVTKVADVNSLLPNGGKPITPRIP